jgi:tRNA threonylcarbamoyladenosine biosynthesis protein TsaB
VLSGRRADAIVVSIGPGAFTGLRVGVAAALGLAKAWDCPVLPTSSLAARAAMISEQPRVLALLDARKGKVYAGLFDTTSGVPVLLSEERDQLPVDAVPPGPGVAVGEGVAVVESLLVAQNWKISDVSSQSPASALAHWGFNRWGSGEGIAAHEVRLRYLRPPDAKRPKLEGLLRSSNEES